MLISVVITLTITGVGFASLIIWRDRVDKEIPERELVSSEGESREDESTVEPSFLSELGAPEVDISTWSTYRNDEFGYETRYPEGYEVSDASKFPRVFSLGETFEHNIFITVSEEPMALGFHGTWGPILQSETDQKIISSEEVLINGVPFIKNYWSAGPTTLTAYTNHSHKVYTLSFASKPEKRGEAAIFDQILSTFRFID